ncbi:hypothetical protein [Bradyrhizobium erythrophlei]|uniref:hypothetical protein n=1 Tax=Bradyrhizobium erythrophlei TaxID=1437360 RepID=UPI001560F9C2|nr:hypothetical protein [Bradyrhizobium erythrophlei]
MMLLIKDRDADRGCFEHAAPTLFAGTECGFGIPPPNDFVLKVRSAGGDTLLKFRIYLTQCGFSALPLTDLSAKKLVCLLKLRRARKRQRQRHHLPDRDPGADREQRRDRFDAALDPIVWIPQGPDAHRVRRAAGKDEETRQYENAGECEIGALQYEINQGDRNRIIGKRDRRIRGHMERDQFRLPEKAHAVRHVILRRHQP